MDTQQMLITAQPEAAVIALNEIQKMDPQARGRRLSPDTQLVTTPLGYGVLVGALPDTVFIRHVCPVHAEYVMDSVDDPQLCAHLTALCQGMPPDEPFSVQLRDEARTDSKPTLSILPVLSAIEHALQAQGYTRDDKQPAWVLSLYRHENTLYAGVSWCADNLSPWNGGVHRLKKQADFVSRAEFKLEEAWASFGLGTVDFAVRKAIDLGAAPGGWTKILLQHGFHVTAVDPGALSDTLMTHPQYPQLVHFRDVAQKFRGQKDSYDLLVNDMRMDRLASCDIMLHMAQFLIPDGRALMTLKLPHSQWYKHTRSALAALQKSYDVLKARQLFHNRSEVMVYLKKR